MSVARHLNSQGQLGTTVPFRLTNVPVTHVMIVNPFAFAGLVTLPTENESDSECELYSTAVVVHNPVLEWLRWLQTLAVIASATGACGTTPRFQASSILPAGIRAWSKSRQPVPQVSLNLVPTTTTGS